MNAKQIFIEYPELEECYVSGTSEAFKDEEECKNYANHFNVSMRKVLREEVSGLPERKAEVVADTKAKKSKDAEPATE